MRDERVDFVKRYLERKFPGATVERHCDFERSAETFKVWIKGDTRLLKVSDEFLDDHSQQEIERLFDRWLLAEVVLENEKLGVLATEYGLTTFER